MKPSFTGLVALLSIATATLAQAIPAAVKSAEAGIDGEKIRARMGVPRGRPARGPQGRFARQRARSKIPSPRSSRLDGLKPGGDNGTYFQMVKFVPN